MLIWIMNAVLLAIVLLSFLLYGAIDLSSHMRSFKQSKLHVNSNFVMVEHVCFDDCWTCKFSRLYKDKGEAIYYDNEPLFSYVKGLLIEHADQAEKTNKDSFTLPLAALSFTERANLGKMLSAAYNEREKKERERKEKETLSHKAKMTDEILKVLGD